MNLLINSMAVLLSIFLTGDAKQNQSKAQMAFKEKLENDISFATVAASVKKDLL
jgi:hypothetical protein